MANASNYLENRLLDHALGVSAFTMPSTIFMALFTSSPTDANTGTEVSGSGYSRQAITFGAASGGSISNNSAEAFTASGGNFGTITHVGFYDASSGGNLLFWGSLVTPRIVNNGETINFGVGSLVITMD